ncbi:MAG TPA: tetratricopeptide repeat protein, partial [Terracidiphilus sp.]|nr:tetratricopeptide repeat protein [Terracidiphilus sp.]
LQLAVMYALFVSVLRAVRQQSEYADADRIAALAAVAWYGLHPAIAETVNYIIQRGDIYATIGVVAGLALYARFPAWRKTGLYLAPVAFAMLSKPPAMAFPALLFIYVVLFEEGRNRRFLRAALAVGPSLALSIALTVLVAAMTPKNFVPSTISWTSYFITQPYVLARYLGQFFFPDHLNVDTDLQAFHSLTGRALFGFVLVAALALLALIVARVRRLRPISFGVLWFLISSLPTSLYRLSEVENDHRMYLPFVGLVLAVTWTVYLAVEWLAAHFNRAIVWRFAVAGAVVLLSAYGYATHLRNRVWRTEETLWLDDVQKCPANGRGLMNYGLSQMAVGNYSVALDYFNRAQLYTPNYKILEVNLGIAHGGLNQSADAAAHFDRAIALDPLDYSSRYFYGRWLYQTGQVGEAVHQLQASVALNSGYLPARDLLAQAFNAAGNNAAAQATAAETLRIDPKDTFAQSILNSAPPRNADYWINASLYQYQMGNYQGCIDSARQALKLKPDSELAYTNIGAAYAALKQWDEAISNEQAALRLKPDYQLAKNNLQLYRQMKTGAGQVLPASATAEDWLNASLNDNRAGQYQKSIRDAQQALLLRPGYAEAYNNIAAAYASLGQWDQAIVNAQDAIRLKPDFQLARNNLAWALSEKAKGTKANR